MAVNAAFRRHYQRIRSGLDTLKVWTSLTWINTFLLTSAAISSIKWLKEGVFLSELIPLLALMLHVRLQKCCSASDKRLYC